MQYAIIKLDYNECAKKNKLKGEGQNSIYLQKGEYVATD